MIRNLNKYNNLLIISIKNNIKSVSAVRRYSSQSNEQSRGNYDVIIAGGGMVGCTLACALGKMSLLSNLKVLLLEGSPDKPFQLTSEYSNRVVALNQNTKGLMTSLDVWQHVEKMRVNPVRHMQVWDACSDALITFSSADIMNDDVAYIVENDVLLHAINTELKSNSVQNVDIVYGAKIVGYELPKSSSGNSECLVKMNDGKSYTCNLLIGADGAKSVVREAMGVQYMSWDYDHMGIVATLHLAEESANNTAWQRFLPTGPVALLPLDSTRSSLVWSTSPPHARELLKLSDESFVDALNDALWKQYPRNSAVDAATSWVGAWLRRAGVQDGVARQLPPSVRAVTPRSRAAFPFGFGHSTKYVAPSVALIGDAAHRVHPLAGQGVNLGFGDVRDLTAHLADALYAGLEINDPSWLSKYESTRQRHNVPTQLAIDALYRLYRADLPPLVLARSVGLQITNALHPLKKFLISHATT